jgi:hypothetical protein
MIIFQSGCLHGSFNKDVSEKSTDLLCCVYCGGAKPPKPWRRQQLSPQWDQDFFIALLCFAMLQTIQFYDLTAYPRDFQSI